MTMNFQQKFLLIYIFYISKSKLSNKKNKIFMEEINSVVQMAEKFSIQKKPWNMKMLNFKKF